MADDPDAEIRALQEERRKAAGTRFGQAEEAVDGDVYENSIDVQGDDDDYPSGGLSSFTGMRSSCANV